MPCCFSLWPNRWPGPFYLLAQTECMVAMSLLVRSSTKPSSWDPCQQSHRAAGPLGTKQPGQASTACLLACPFHSSGHKSSGRWRCETQSQTQVFPCAQERVGLVQSRKSFGNHQEFFHLEFRFQLPYAGCRFICFEECFRVI